ncbi:hypothetical protein [Streptomyces sp. ODS05-4]|uniref:hypothetical protein n=1 Tax=Streptomyces sp. ODS05-4 TaxID=2944939 RepID=UPI00210E6FB5|nr:hypothetical protein [Streptomyces sp. ODS05-4]
MIIKPLWATAVVLLAAASGLHASETARADDLAVTVLTDVMAPEGYRELPGVSRKIAAGPGQQFVLHADRFAMRTVQPLTGTQYLGTTTALLCPSDQRPNGVHYGNNIVPVDNETVEPAVRWVFRAPHTSGVQTYTCTLAVDFYSSNAPRATDVRVTSATGAIRIRAESDQLAAESWTLPAALDPSQGAADLVRPKTTAALLDHTYVTTGSRRASVAVRQDAQISTCHRRTPYRACPVGSQQFSTVSTWVRAQPQDALGADCAPARTGPVSRARITAREHHRTMPNSLELRMADLPVACDRLRLSLMIQAEDGDVLLVHGGEAMAGTYRTAYSHGYAYEYNPVGPLADRVEWATPLAG